MIQSFDTILPAAGRGTTRRVVEGARLPTQGCAIAMAPSVTRCARATSPCRGGF